MSVYVWHDGSSALSPLLSKLTVQHGASMENLTGIKEIIHWCGDDRILNAKKCLVLNHSSYTKLLLDENKIHTTLQLHSIIYTPPHRSASNWLVKQHDPHYLIPVFLMEALAIFHLDGEDSLTLKRDSDSHMLYEVRNEQKTALLRRLERYAVRAVYAMGLDYACVYAQVQRSGKAVITRIDINPIQSEQVIDLYAQAVNDYSNGWLSEELERKPAIFGMDPEFLLRNTQGRIVPASRYLPAKGSVGYDSATVLGRRQLHPLAELRPEPSEKLAVLVNNLRRTMWKAAAQITDHSLQWIAGGMPVPGLPLGGHLHMSGIRLNTRLIRAMDNYLALPLIMIEDTSTRGRRKKYGRLGDVRRPSHGGFEYRTLPSWIVSPRVTKGVLALASLIVKHYEELVDRPLDRSEILIAYREGNKHVLEPIVRSLWLQLEGTAGYIDQHKYLEPLKNWIMEQRIWNEQLDFRAVWRIPPFN
ncbi:MAG: hypothetical protein WD424_03460 [Paenibacillaceae bacterium]